MIVLRDTRTRFYFNRPSLSHHGCWLPSYAQAPSFETPADAWGYMRAAGMALDGSIEPFEVEGWNYMGDRELPEPTNPLAALADEMRAADAAAAPVADVPFSLVPKADRRRGIQKGLF